MIPFQLAFQEPRSHKLSPGCTKTTLNLGGGTPDEYIDAGFTFLYRTRIKVLLAFCSDSMVVRLLRI